MTTQVLTPVDVGDAVELSGQSGRWRKQILPMRKITYKGRVLNFNRAYLATLADSFKRRAFDQVPAQIADKDNKHNNDPHNTGGELVDVELAADGLYGVFQPNAAGQKILEANPKIGVSARILEGYQRSDGTHFPKALQHVLLTVDPHISGMKPWERAMSLSSELEIETTLDLSGYEEENEVGDTKTKAAAGGPGTDEESVTLSRAEYTAFTEMMAERKAALEFADELKPEDVEDEDGDEEDEDGDTQTADVPAVPESVRLTLDAQSARILELTNTARAREVEHEVEKLGATGLAPAIIEAARPLLGLADATIELSNGDELDVPKTVKGLLQTIIGLANNGEALVNYDQEIGLTAAEDPAQAQRNELLAAWEQAAPTK